MKRHHLVLPALALALASPATAAGRRVDVGLQVVTARVSQLDATDVGLGASASFRLTHWVAADAGLGFFPRDLGTPATSGSRLEALAGVRVGPRLGRAGVYAALRGGVVRFGAAPEPFPCILIYPPPISCALGGGDTLPAASLGLGAELFPRDHLVLRVEVGDRLLRYPGPAIGRGRDVHEDDFWDHDVRFAVSIGLRL